MCAADSVPCAPCQYWRPLGLGQGFKEGGGVRERVRGCPREAAAGEVPGQLGSHLCPPRRPPQSSFLQEAAQARLTPAVPAMSRPVSPLGPSIQGRPKAGLAGQACISFLSQVNISLASSPPSPASVPQGRCPLPDLPFPRGSANWLLREVSITNQHQLGFPRR